MHPIYALWCHPRSMSTAFERVMRERGDLDVLHEPFLHSYYAKVGRAFPHYDQIEDHPADYAATREMIAARAKRGPVFFKDMAYYHDGEMLADLDFAKAIRHAFLIRDPAASIVSYARLDPDFAAEEVGCEAQWRLFEGLRNQGLDPIVVRADDVRRDPAEAMTRYWRHVGLRDAPHALSWNAEIPKDWQYVAGWHQSVVASTGIRPPDPARNPQADLAELGAPYTEYDAYHRPFYERLLQEAL